MAEKSPPYQEEEWELLPSNTSFLEFGLEDIKDLISTEIDYMDYLREEHLLKFIQDQQENQWKKPAAELTASTNQASDGRKTVVPEEFAGTKAEDPKQSCTEENSRGSELEDKGSATGEKEKENSAGRPCCKRGLAASIGMLCSVAAAAATAACVVMLGGGLHHQQRRREEALRFQIYADNKALKRLNQVLVATAREPPPAMRTATISFGSFFDGL